MSKYIYIDLEHAKAYNADIEFFNENNGFDKEDIEAINNLQPNQYHIVSCPYINYIVLYKDSEGIGYTLDTTAEFQ